MPPVYCRKATSLAADLHRVERVRAALREHLGPADRARQRPRRHHLLHAADHEVRDRALGKAERVADAGHHDVAQRSAREHLLERRGGVLEDHDHRRARVVQLVLELARRVERVDVDDRAARPVRAHDRDRVLQDVRHHERDAVALAQAGDLLQPGPEAARLLLHLGVREPRPHVGERRLRRMLAAGVFVQVLERRNRVRDRSPRGRPAGSRGARSCLRPCASHSLLHRKIPSAPRAGRRLRFDARSPRSARSRSFLHRRFWNRHDPNPAPRACLGLHARGRDRWPKRPRRKRR